MRTLFTLISLFIITSINAQSKKDFLVKNWKLHKTIEFGQEYNLLDNQKNDFIQFFENNSFKGVVEGKHVEGTWSIKDNKVALAVNKKLSKTKINWAKVKLIESEKLHIEYQNGDLITSVLLFVPA